MFCVYLTVYRGNKLPMFYIGSSSVAKVESGYHGSIKSKKYMSIYKSELIQNPHLFITKIISIHEKRCDAYRNERRLQRVLHVVESPMYMNESYVYGDKWYNNSGNNNGFYGKHHTPETISKLSKPRSENTKRKMRKPKSPEHRLKILHANNGRFRDYSLKETCVYCGKQAMKTNIIRWHNERCKSLAKEVL